MNETSVKSNERGKNGISEILLKLFNHKMLNVQLKLY